MSEPRPNRPCPSTIGCDATWGSWTLQGIEMLKSGVMNPF